MRGSGSAGSLTSRIPKTFPLFEPSGSEASRSDGSEPRLSLPRGQSHGSLVACAILAESVGEVSSSVPSSLFPGWGVRA